MKRTMKEYSQMIENYFSECKNKREQFMNNVLELSINSGKVNEKAELILYSEDSNIEKKKKIQDTKEDLKNIVNNVKNIAESLELPIEEILNQNN